ncbi:MAG: cyclic nucleotide-binding domain-containing protein [Alphaproteobacteria bacterium]|nr:cyclic nucleotide-binding domain-containing protein [Alphaproteobacteria bacterium]MDP6515567.1 cyclic nucleotide-binding domain-containing protein [Alphaproteobacteria bacterium]
MIDVLIRVFNVQRDDIRPSSRLIAFRFCTGFAFIVAETVAMTLFLSRFEGSLFGFTGIAVLPVVFVMGSIVTTGLGAILLSLQAHLSVGRLILGNMVLILILVVGFYVAIVTTEWPYLYPALFIVIEIIWVLFALNAELTANCIFDVRQVKRVTPLINGGETISFIVGAYTVAGLVPVLGVANVLLVAGLFLMLALAIYLTIMTHAGSALTQVAAKEPARRRPAPILNLRFVWLLAGFVMVMQFAIYITYTQSRAVINLTYDELEIAICLGVLEGTMGVARAVLAFFVVNRVIAKIGLFPVAAFVPVALVVTSVLVVLGPQELVFAFVLACYVADRVLRFSFGNATTPLMYHCLPGPQKPKVQAFVSGVVAPVGAGLSGLLLLTISDRLTGSFADLAAVSWALIGIGLMVLPIVYFLRRDYLILLLDLAQRKRLDVADQDFIDPSAVAFLHTRLAAEDPVDTVFAIDTLQNVDPDGLVESLPALIRRSDTEVRLKALDVVIDLCERRDLSALAGQIVFEPKADPEIRIAVTRARAAILGSEAMADLEPALQDPVSEVRVAARAAVARWGGEAGLKPIRAEVESLAAHDTPQDRIEALAIVGQSGVAELWQPVSGLVFDGSPEVRAQACQVIGSLKLADFYPTLVEALRDPATRAVAMQRLSDVGAGALPAIARAFGEETDGGSVKFALIQLAGRIDDPGAQSLLANSLTFSDVQARQLALEQLFRAPRLWLDLEWSQQFELLEDEFLYYQVLARIALVVAREKSLPGVELLADALSDALEDTVIRVLLALRFVCPPGALPAVYANWSHPASRPLALEILDNVVPGAFRDTVLILFDRLDMEERLRRLTGKIGSPAPVPADLAGVVALLCKERSGRYNTWIRICALNSAAGLDEPTRGALAAPHCDAAEPILREVALRIRDGLPDGGATQETGAVLSTIEKLLFLKKVPIFAQVRDEYLANLARLLEELSFESGEEIVRENEVGESMFVIVSGSVRILSGSRQVAVLGPGECFGEMAVLDAGPRSATVIADEPCLVLAMDGRDLFDIMSRQIEVVRGLFKVLSGRLRSAQQEPPAGES